jgi:drug/metabolite transporter (DMT)-like permease
MGKPWRWPAMDRWRLLLCAALAVHGYNLPVAFAARSISAGHIGLLIATEPILIIIFGGAMTLAGVAIGERPSAAPAAKFSAPQSCRPD